MKGFDEGQARLNKEHVFSADIEMHLKETVE
jgi:hypothetical protein